MEEPTEEVDTFNVCTVDDYQEVPEMSPPELIRPLFEHNAKTVTKCLEAEFGDPVVTADGSMFKSRIGCIANNPGSGKTSVVIALSQFESPPDDETETVATSLMVAQIVSKPREFIDCSMIVMPKSLLGPWELDCSKFLGNGSWWTIPTNEKLFEAVTRKISIEKVSKEGQKLCDIGLDGVMNYITFVQRSISDQERLIKFAKENDTFDESMDRYLNDIKNKLAKAQYMKVELEIANLKASRKGRVGIPKNMQDDREEFGRKFIIQYVVEQMRKYKIVFCDSGIYYMLMPLFRKYKISRLFIDEIQQITFTNQNDIKGDDVNEAVQYISSRGKTLTYRERSPARFIWLITATPYLIEGNTHTKGGGSHFFNQWLYYNAPFFKDYINAPSGNYMFPEVIKRYIIKFPDGYINDVIWGGKNYVHKVVLRVKKPFINSQLQGAINGLDDLLENDDKVGIFAKLGISDESQIISGTIAYLQKEIDNWEESIRGYVGPTAAHNTRVAREKIATIQAKIDKINENGNRLLEKLNEGCCVCYDQFNPVPTTCPPEMSQNVWAENLVVMCNMCKNIFHNRCLMESLRRGNHACPMCRVRLKLDDIKQIVSDNTHIEVIRNETEESKVEQIVYNNKHDALFAAIVGVRKGLIYLNSSEDHHYFQLVKDIAAQGFNVRISSTMTKAEKATKFGQLDDRIINPRPKNKMVDDLRDFQATSTPTLWILKTTVSSAGLNFPFIDAIICYSNFREKEQIIGRGLRKPRDTPFKYIVMEYED